MKSLLILNGHKYVTRFFLPVAKQAVNKGFEIDLMIPEGSIKSEIPESLFRNIFYFTFERIRFDLFRFFKNIIDFKKIDSENYKIIHLVSSKVILSFMISLFFSLKKEKKITIIFHFIGLGRLLGHKGFLGRLLRLIFKFFAKNIENKNLEYKIIYLNKNDKKILENIFSEKVFSFHIIQGAGVDLKKFDFINRKIQNPLNLLFLGRLIPEKGVSFFIDICNDLKNLYKINFKARIVGSFEDTNFRQKVFSQIEDYNLVEDIEIIGEVENPQKFYELSDLFIFPSTYGEGIPTVIIEALATGLPTLSSDIPGCKEIFSDNNSEYIIKGFRKDSWCKKIIEFSKNDEIYQLSSIKGRRKVEELFQQKDLAKKTISLYVS